MEKKSVFTIGADTDLTFVGYSSDLRWNGFAQPYFSEEVMKVIFSKTYLFQNEESESQLSFEDGVLYETYDGEKIVICDGTIINGEKHWFFGCGWCWEEVTSLGYLAELCESFDNGNGEWDNVREDERDYLVETIEFHSLNNY
jgi:hypothetical protein